MGSNHTVSTLEERCWLQQQLGVLALCRDFGCCGLLLSFFVSKNNIQESVTRMPLHHRKADGSFVKISILCGTPSLLSFMKCGFIVFLLNFLLIFYLGFFSRQFSLGFTLKILCGCGIQPIGYGQNVTPTYPSGCCRANFEARFWLLRGTLGLTGHLADLAAAASI